MGGHRIVAVGCCAAMMPLGRPRVRARPIIALCCCAVILVTAPGCSLLSMTRPPSEPVAPDELRCTSSRAAPVADVVGIAAIVAGTIAAEAAIFSGSYGPNPCGNTSGWGALGCNLAYEINRDQYARVQAAGGVLVAAGGLALAVVYGLSVGQGFKDAARCDELRDWAARAAVDPSVPWPVEKPAGEEGEAPPIQPSAVPPTPHHLPEKVPENGRCEDDHDCAEGLVCPMGWCKRR